MMVSFEQHLEVKTSQLPNAGNGLFTKEFIPKGSCIVEYKGRRTTWDQVRNDADNGYIYYVDDSLVIDGKADTKALARYANDARGLTRIKGITNNARYIHDDDKVYIEAAKDIPAGAEIFVNYGKEYWDTVRTNQKIDDEKNKKRA
jgi:SET domain-containing protein